MPDQSTNDSIKLGIIGPVTYVSELKVKNLIYKLKAINVELHSGGNLTGVEYYVKKYAMQFDIPYWEYNPAYTSHRLHSIFQPEWYDKVYYQTHDVHRYQILIRNIDKLVIAVDSNFINWKMYIYLEKYAKKYKKPVIHI